MSDKEIQRLSVLQDVLNQRITQVRAAEILNLSIRQITRLLQKLLPILEEKTLLLHPIIFRGGYHENAISIVASLFVNIKMLIQICKKIKKRSFFIGKKYQTYS